MTVVSMIAVMNKGGAAAFSLPPFEFAAAVDGNGKRMRFPVVSP
jgi:hypothetical protein